MTTANHHDLSSAKAYAGAAVALLDVAASLKEAPSEDSLRSIAKALSCALEETLGAIPSTTTNPPQEPTPKAQNVRKLLDDAYESLLDIEGGLNPIIRFAYFHEETDSELSGLGPLLNMVRLRALASMNKIAMGLDPVTILKGGDSV